MTQHNFISTNFADILKKYNYNLNPGDIVAGTIIYKEKKGFLVNIGDNTAGYLPEEEISIQYLNSYQENNSFINVTRDFFLIKYNAYLKQHILSIKRLEYIRSWKRIKQLNLEDIIFTLKISQFNKGGIITHLEGIQGFVPKSQIYFNTYKYNSELLNHYIKCNILLADEQKNQLILSNKSASIKLSKHQLKIGELLYGIIVKIKPYGIFIEINGIIALLHISEIKSSYIQNIQYIFHLHSIIKVKIIHIDIKQGRLSVSKKYISNRILLNHHQQL